MMEQNAGHPPARKGHWRGSLQIWQGRQKWRSDEPRSKVIIKYRREKGEKMKISLVNKTSLFHHENNVCKFLSNLTWNSFPFLIKNPDYVTCNFKMQSGWRTWVVGEGRGENKFSFEECLIIQLTSPEVGPPPSCLRGKVDFGGLYTVYSTLGLKTA